MNFEELLAEFRALGGVAENVRLGVGARGRGIFVIDPEKTATLHAPENLLIPVEDLVLRDGDLAIGPESRVGNRERAFFELLQKGFGWGAGGREEALHSQARWNQLSSPVIDAIRTMGASEDLDSRFDAPSAELCARLFAQTRHFALRGRRWLVPIVDFVNHSSGVATYVTEAGAGVRGIFEDEMLVRYNVRDAWNRAIAHGFAERTLLAHSLTIDLDIAGYHLSIGRDIAAYVSRDGIMYPEVSVRAGVMRVPFLVLGNSAAPDLPRAIFRKIVDSYFATGLADQIFDNVVHFNAMKFLGLLRTLQAYDGALERMLQEAATAQLETLSCCCGARAV